MQNSTRNLSRPVATRHVSELVRVRQPVAPLLALWCAAAVVPAASPAAQVPQARPDTVDRDTVPDDADARPPGRRCGDRGGTFPTWPSLALGAAHASLPPLPPLRPDMSNSTSPLPGGAAPGGVPRWEVVGGVVLGEVEHAHRGALERVTHEIDGGFEAVAQPDSRELVADAVIHGG